MVVILLLLLYIKYNKYILKISRKGMSHECHISSFVLLWYVLYMDINDCVVWMLVQLCSRRRHEYPLTLHRLDLRSFCGFSKHSQSWDMVWVELVIDQHVGNEYLQNTITTSQGGKGNVSFAHGLKMLDHSSPLTCWSHSFFFDCDARFWSGSTLTPMASYWAV